MSNYADLFVRSWIAWIEFWDRIAAAERARLAAERAARELAAASAQVDGERPPAA